MTIAITLFVGILVGLVIGWDRGFRKGSLTAEHLADAEFRRGKELGEKTARFHNRSFIRYEGYVRSTLGELMGDGPFVEEPN